MVAAFLLGSPKLDTQGEIQIVSVAWQDRRKVLEQSPWLLGGVEVGVNIVVRPL